MLFLGPGRHEPSPPSPHNCCSCPLPIPANHTHTQFTHPISYAVCSSVTDLVWKLCVFRTCSGTNVYWRSPWPEDHTCRAESTDISCRVWSDIQRWFDDDCVISLHGFWMHLMTGSMLCHLDDVAEHHCIKDKFRSFNSPPNWCLLQLFLWYFSVTVIITCPDIFCAATNFVVNSVL